MRPPPKTRAAVWPLLAVLALFVFGGLSHEGRRQIDRDIASGDYRVTPVWTARALRAYLTNEDDMYRLAAYADAALGRPYRSFFIRRRVEWDATFARGVQEDPDAWPVVAPAEPLRPYRDFFVEYPPAAFLAFMPPALLSATPDGYAFVFKLEMALCWLFVLVLLRSLGQMSGEPEERAAGWPRALAVAILSLGMVCTHRYDAFVAACLTAALLSAARGGGLRAGLWLGLGAAVKGVPLLVSPVLFAWLWVASGRRAAIRFAAATGATVAGLLGLGVLWGGPGVFEAFVYHQARPVQIESTAGALLGLGSWLRPGLVTVVHSFSSRNLRGDLVPVFAAATSLLALVMVSCATVIAIGRLRATRDPRSQLVVAAEGCLAVLASYVVLGKVFCPQYVLWLLPFGLVAARSPGRSPRRLMLGLAILVATQVIYPIAYGAVKTLAPWAMAIVLARNVGILLWSGTLLVRTRHQSVTLGAERVVTDCEPAL